MAQYQTVQSHTATINRPLCVICDTQMWLSCVEAEGTTLEKRTFECPVCATFEFSFVKFKQAGARVP